ncbi:hypothetical protein ACHQM5_008790 [Ranunculus cassubicifolius]
MVQKRKYKAAGVEAEDRISHLPDNILHHILSFLGTEEAVDTCVLSRRWRYIWMGIHTLDFDEDRMMETTSMKIDLVNFVRRVFRLHDGSVINKVKLSTCENCNSNNRNSDLEELVSEILRRKVQELDLFLYDGILMPHSLYCCESLTVMKLMASSHSTFSLPASVCFPILKFMHLGYSQFTCGEGIQQVSFSCQVLQEFKLIECIFDSFEAMHIFVPALERLNICEWCSERSNTWRDASPQIKIYAESLVSLDVFRGLSFDLSLCNVMSLNSASINMKNDDYVSNLFHGIQNVKELTLCDSTLEILPSVKVLLALSNLNKLTLTEIRPLNGELFIELLCSVPQIQSFIISSGIFKRSFEVYDFKAAEIPNSFLSHLKSFEIQGFFGKESEMYVVEFLLKNVSAIERVFIKSSPEISENLKKQNEVMRRLLILPRASASCLIVFS